MGRALAPTQEKIVITMLGGFTMSCAGRSVSDSAGRIHQVWNLLEYLIVNREREVSRDELSEILWDEEECENPQNALKNLVYRARGVLSDAGIGAARDLVIYHRGSYRWSGEFPAASIRRNLSAASPSSAIRRGTPTNGSRGRRRPLPFTAVSFFRFPPMKSG